MTAHDFIALLDTKGIKASAFGPQEVRFVFHLDISEEMMALLLAVITAL